MYFPWSLCMLLVSFVLCTASPFLEKRHDIDDNGIPDLCFGNENGLEHCLMAIVSSWMKIAGSSSPQHSSTHSTSSRTSKTASISHITITTIATATKSSPTKPPNPSSSAKGVLPPPTSFKALNNTTWRITKIGVLKSTSIPRLGWDKGRSSSLSSTYFWNFGDVLSLDGLSNGFSMGAAFYATPNNILLVDTKNITSVTAYDFAKPDSSDPVPDPKGDTPSWGMDTSNIAEVRDGVGIGFVWEIWRSAGGKYVDRGAGIINVMLGNQVPIATRIGPLITGSDGLQIGLMTIMNAEGYIYTYTNSANPSGLVIGRAKVDVAFDPASYSFLKLNGSWSTPGTGIPKSTDMSYGVDGKIHSDGQGSITFSSYFGKYLLFTGKYGWGINFYTSDTPYGPWVGEYQVTSVQGYGVNVHPGMVEEGEEVDERVMYVSSGVGNVISVYKLEFEVSTG